MSTILTKESLGYKDAEISDGTRVRADIDRGSNRILIIEWRGCYVCTVLSNDKSPQMKSGDVAITLWFKAELHTGSGA